MTGSGVAFVDGDDDFLLAASQHIGDIFIHGGKTLFGVDKEKYDVGFVDGEGYLFANLYLELVVATHDIATSVDDGEILAVPVGMAILAVAGHARGLIDDRFALFDKAIEQCRLAHIRASYYGNNIRQD